MEGGRLLGQGSYGCVFQPALLCKSNKQIRSTRVGKVTLATDASNEVKVSNVLRNVPLAKNYFLLNDPEVCDLAPKSQQTEKDINKCKYFEKEPGMNDPYSVSIQTFSPYGGKTTFYTLLTTSNLHPKFFDFFAFTQHLLEAGSTLTVAGVVHFDLHPNNLLLDQKNVVRILDFGNSFLAKDISKAIVEERWKILRIGMEKDAPNPVITNMEAPEITILNCERNKIPYKKAIELIVGVKEIFRDMERYLGISRQKSKDHLLNFWETSKVAQEQDATNLFKLYWPGFDAWAIGSILLRVFRACITWPEFQQGPFAERQHVVYATLRGILEPNPKKRLDCVEALATFDPQSSWIQHYGQSWLQARKAQRQRQI